MIRYASLKTLPPEVSFPEDLRSRIHHDAAVGRLGFDGFMSKAVFDRLYRLSDDWDYRQALERLFTICTFDAEYGDSSGGQSKLVYVAGLAGAAGLTLAVSAWIWLAT